MARDHGSIIIIADGLAKSTSRTHLITLIAMERFRTVSEKGKDVLRKVTHRVNSIQRFLILVWASGLERIRAKTLWAGQVVNSRKGWHIRN